MSALQAVPVIIIAVLVILDIVAIGFILLRKLAAASTIRRSADIARQLAGEFPKLDDHEIMRRYRTKRSRLLLFEQYIETRQSLRMAADLDGRIRRLLISMGMRRHFVGRLRSLRRVRRIEAAVHLGHLGGNRLCGILEHRLEMEKNWLVKLYIAYALSEINMGRSILPVVESLVGAPQWYQDKVRLFIIDFGYQVHATLPVLMERPEKEIRLLIAHFASECVGKELLDYIKKSISDPDADVRHASARALTSRYVNDPACSALLAADDIQMKTYAVEALSDRPSRENAAALLALLDDQAIAPRVISVLSRMCGRSHAVLDYIMHRYNDPEYRRLQNGIIEILSNRVDYFIVKLNTTDRAPARNVIAAMLDRGFVNTVFGFLSLNKDREIENELLDIIKERAMHNQTVARSACRFLDERMLQKIAMAPEKPQPPEISHRKSAVRRSRLIMQLAILLSLSPLLFCLRHWPDFGNLSFTEAITRFVLDGNYYLVFYSATVSGIYLLLLLFSAIGAIRQFDYSRIKKKTFLFRRNILPGISVIGPAFNEEAGIIESVNSLLNLRYPDHEVIIVNDGSRDRTLNRLIDYFKLEKVDVVIRQDILTRPVRGVYRNSSFPKLTVVDKLNGGKADSLNTGINFAGKEYFCGIDADSLLSEEALLKIISTSLDIERETVAMGGNIFPVNGCTVNRGVIESIGTPKNVLANFQFIEYIRAFMAGRIGWAFIDAMLIISGAFGLFKRQRVVECGGYLTSSGKFGLDTVGEDMELVVRLARSMHERKLPCKIGYSHNANCWTEVPQRLGVLLRQRDRWHRGLIEIFAFHHDMLARNRYGRIGWIALPYFLLFEILGPWIEAQGYLLVVTALVFGIMNVTMALWLFIATVMLGVFISISALIIAEQEVNYFRMPEVLKLIGYAIIENFGFRQLMSMWRVVGYISAVRGTGGWGKMVRRGFGGKG